MTDRSKIVLKVTFVLAILSYSFWSYIKELTGIRIFYPTMALCFSGYTYVIYEFVRIAYKTNKKLRSLLLWAEIILASTLSSLLDEIFFNPTVIELNEYIGFLIIIIIAIYNDRKRKT